MRLLEPLSGIKSAQGHALIHLLFFLITWSVNTEYCSLDHHSSGNSGGGHHS